MTTEVDMSGRTVTVFGDRDVLDRALGDELARRGCNTHIITTPMGWLASSSRAVVRLDTPAGDDAFRALTAADHPKAQIVVACVVSQDKAWSTQIDAACRRCGEQHDIVLVWHPPLDVPPGAAVDDGNGNGSLASTIIDRVVIDGGSSAPSYASHTFVRPGQPEK